MRSEPSWTGKTHLGVPDEWVLDYISTVSSVLDLGDPRLTIEALSRESAADPGIGGNKGLCSLVDDATAPRHDRDEVLGQVEDRVAARASGLHLCLPGTRARCLC